MQVAFRSWKMQAKQSHESLKVERWCPLFYVLADLLEQEALHCVSEDIRINNPSIINTNIIHIHHLVQSLHFKMRKLWPRDAKMTCPGSKSWLGAEPILANSPKAFPLHLNFTLNEPPFLSEALDKWKLMWVFFGSFYKPESLFTTHVKDETFSPGKLRIHSVV